MGLSVGQRAPVYQRGPSVGQISPRRSTNIFLVRVTLHRLTLECLRLVIRPSVGQMGPPSIRMDPLSVRGGPTSIRGVLFDQISPPSVKNIFLVRGAHRRLTEAFCRSLAPERQFDNVVCSHGRRASQKAHLWVFLLARGTFHQ